MTEGEPGLIAVRRECGPSIERRIRLWPDIALAYAWAMYRDDRGEFVSFVDQAVKKARVALNRVKRDVNYALDQGRSIVRHAELIERVEGSLDAIPPIAKLREFVGDNRPILGGLLDGAKTDDEKFRRLLDHLERRERGPTTEAAYGGIAAAWGRGGEGTQGS